MVSAEGKKIPVFESPVGLIEGAEVLPAATVVAPLVEFKLPLKVPAVRVADPALIFAAFIVTV
jgi:hypothetical protein